MTPGTLVRHRRTKMTGTILRDMGICQPDHRFAPEQAYMVEFVYDVPLSEGRRGYIDQQGCWASDLETI